MVETPLTHTSGHKSNSFSSVLNAQLHWPFGGYRLFSVYMLALLGAGLITLALFIWLVWSHQQSVQAFEQDTTWVQTINQLLSRVQELRIEGANWLASANSHTQANLDKAITQLQSDFDSILELADADKRYELQPIMASTARYISTLRSLSKLQQIKDARTTQQMVQNVLNSDIANIQVDAQNILAYGQESVEKSRQKLHEQDERIALFIGAALSLTFSVCILLTRRITHKVSNDLSLIIQAAQGIAAGNLETSLSLKRNDEIGNLASAFNRMADGLKKSLKTASSASEQNYRQLMKLARQERVNAILEERQRIARELHDSVKQQLFSITLSAGAALNLLKHAPELAKTYIEHVQHAGTYAQSEMTTLLEELVPVPLQDQRLEDALAHYLRVQCDAHHFKLMWRAEGTNTLSIAQEHALFRAVQEAIANVVRHSEATLVRVAISFGLTTRVVIEDNGKGFDVNAIPATSTGLATMKLRLRGVGGSYQLISGEKNGTRLVITVDLRKKGGV
jgi:NarL family two-component system sensor histidine kinase LiaS